MSVCLFSAKRPDFGLRLLRQWLFFTGLICTISVSAQTLLPDQCVGNWAGTMHIYQVGALRDSVKVKFTVDRLTDTSWTWRMEYLSATMPMTKDYVLRLRNKQQQLYVTDEGGGLDLMEYRFGTKLYAVFETQGILLTSSYELRTPNELVFEVTSGKKLPAGHPEVSNYSVTSLQRAILRRQ